MNYKKILASALSAAVAFSAMSFSAFAATTLNLNVDKTSAAAGDTVTVSLPFSNLEKTVNAITVDLEYDDEAFEYVSTSYPSFFNLMSNKTDNVGDGAPNGKVSYSKDDMDCTVKSGDLFKATFRVKSGAAGGSKEFKITSALVGSNDGSTLFNTSSSDTVTPNTITIQAPRKIVAPSVTVNGDKTASWTNSDIEVAPAEYKVVLYKDGTAVYETKTTTPTFDFSSKVDVSAIYNVGVTALQTSSLFTDSDEKKGTDTKFTVNSTVTPDSRAYVTGSGPITFTLGLNGNELSSVKIDGSDVAYNESDGIVTIQEANVKAGTYEFTFNYSGSEVNRVDVPVTVTTAADSAILVFAEREKTDNTYQTDDTTANDGSNDGLIVVTNGNVPVTGFLSAQFSINNAADPGFDKVDYEIIPADGYSLLYDEEADIYEINVKPVNGTAPSIKENNAGEGIVIGKLVRKGNSYGKGTITASPILITVEKSDNTYKTLNGTNLSFQYNIPEPTEKLNVNVNFTLPTLTSNGADYQNMTVNLYSARLGNIELALGNNDGLAPVYTSEDGKIKATLTSSDNKYVLALEGLPKFEAYTVSIKGDGYRDAKAQFVLNEETTVNFWNNANDSDIPFITKASEKKFGKVNFLAGDIIMNGTIDLYDLSAVSSYYGKKGITAGDAQYIQYDLNRDGGVDIIDITMLLAGWAR